MAWPDDFEDLNAGSFGYNLTTTVEAIFTRLETIEQKLGLLPQGASDTVTERLDAIEASVTDGLTTLQTTIEGTFSDLADSDDPYPVYGKIYTPDNPTGNGKMHVGTNPPDVGPDYEVELDTSA